MKRMKLLMLSSLLLLAPLAGCSNAVGNGVNRVDGNDARVTGVSLDNSYLKLEEGQIVQLIPTITYKDDVEVNVYKFWKSSNTKVATVDQNGMVSAIGGGIAHITFIAGYKSASCMIEIPKNDTPVDPDDPTPEPPQPGEFTIRLTETSIEMGYGETHQLTAVTSEEAEVTWSVTEGGNIVTVDNSGLVSTGTVSGRAKVTATANEKSASCYVDVSDTDGDDDANKTVRFYFFIDYNSTDEKDDTGTKLLASFKWYPDRPVGDSGLVPNTPAKAPTDDFPYFIGWSDHPFVDTKDDLIDVSTYCAGNTRNYKYIFGIWSDVTKEAFVK